jgi:hypothetical protein
LPEAAIANFRVDLGDICLLPHDRNITSEGSNCIGGGYPRMPPKHGRYSAKFWDATIDSSPSDRFHAGGEGLICQEIEVVIDIRDYSTK